MRRCIECNSRLRAMNETGFCGRCWPRVTVRELLSSVGMPITPTVLNGLVAECFVCKTAQATDKCHTLITEAATIHVCKEGACLQAFKVAVDVMHSTYKRANRPVMAEVWRDLRDAVES